MLLLSSLIAHRPNPGTILTLQTADPAKGRRAGLPRHHARHFGAPPLPERPAELSPPRSPSRRGPLDCAGASPPPVPAPCSSTESVRAGESWPSPGGRPRAGGGPRRGSRPASAARPRVRGRAAWSVGRRCRRRRRSILRSGPTGARRSTGREILGVSRLQEAERTEGGGVRSRRGRRGRRWC